MLYFIQVSNMNKESNKKWKYFEYLSLLWIILFSTGLVRKTLQNDTFYTIKIGESIFKNGIDMMDHFSIHANLAYTYPHWLYDCFIYLIHSNFGYIGLYASSIILFAVLLICVFKTCVKVSNNYIVSAIATFICAVAIRHFVTARAQLASFILFALEIYFIESFLKTGKKRNLIGLLLVSLLLCNIHVAVWPFYFILLLPYFAEYIISIICNKIKKENRTINFLKNKIILEKNSNIKYLFIIFLISTLTGLFTPIHDTPYTYLIKTMIGNSQNYIIEHQISDFNNGLLPIVLAIEAIIFAILSKIKLRDMFMMAGLVVMALLSTRHSSLLALVGSICLARIFTIFLKHFEFDISDKILNILSKKIVIIIMFLTVIIYSSLNINKQLKTEYIDHKEYPIEAVKYIKQHIDIDKMRLFNEYNFGSYLILNDIPVFIDSRADLYTRQFSGLDYDIFDDFEFITSNFQEKFEFYKITHVLLTKNQNIFTSILNNNIKYKKTITLYFLKK